MLCKVLLRLKPKSSILGEGPPSRMVQLKIAIFMGKIAKIAMLDR